MVTVAHLVRALVCGTRGSEFEAHLSHFLYLPFKKERLENKILSLFYLEKLFLLVIL